MAKKKPARPARPQKSAEPTTAQLRQEYYARRAAEQALEELGLRLDERPAPKGDANWWSEAQAGLDRLEIMHAVWRFTGLTGYAPEPEDFDPDQGWPTPSEVEAVFGSWDKMLDESGIDEAIFGVVVEKALAAHEKLGAREKELEQQARKLEDEGRKIPELKRREEVARAKRDEADTARQEAEAARDAIGRERDALAARIADLQAEADGLRAAAAASADARAGGAELELLEEMERALADQAATQQARDELHDRMERLRAEREQDRRTIAELTQLLARVDAEVGTAAVDAEPETPPATVLEAVERAAAEAKHLRFAPKAFETAADSPFRRPGLVLRTLRNLDELAGRYATGDMGKSLGQAAAEHGITQWKPDIAETTRKRYEDDYSFALEGSSRKLWVGPHIGLGSGSGAQFIARVYLHVSDGSDPEVPRGIVVAVVGRHLPDTTT
ncbi:MAG TPA: hypothetical protein VK501_10780 [Baekduia sp.]|uniref:hypothetical protein n=1 Tax=Baekduia sp. TaxID=2600305 RepID=UPI002B81555E|nr:hypothetical protein [Baekduia sp.]HMJ34390.1 hypothetical protein [Baekduia sp.]